MNGITAAEAYDVLGVRISLGASDRELLDQLVALLPANVTPCDPADAERHYAVLEEREGVWAYRIGEGRGPLFTDLALVLSMLNTELHNYIAGNVRACVFIHAGAVAHQGRAIVIPGDSFSGKSSLVAALIRAGAVYYSDEYAVLDDQGLLHPYARPLSIREGDERQGARHTVESLGGSVGETAVPVGLVVQTRYRPGARFAPQRRSEGQGAIMLLGHAGPARERPEETLRVIRRAIAGAIALEGDRGEADIAAGVLLDALAGEPEAVREA